MNSRVEGLLLFNVHIDFLTVIFAVHAFFIKQLYLSDTAVCTSTYLLYSVDIDTLLSGLKLFIFLRTWMRK